MIYEDIADPDPENAEPIKEEALMPDVKYFESMDAYDQYISVSVMLSKDDGFDRALVTRRKQDLDGNIIGSRHSNPLLGNCVYVFQFQGGSINDYADNLIAEKLYSQTYTDDD